MPNNPLVVASDVVSRRVQLAHHDADGNVTLETTYDAQDVVDDVATQRNHTWQGNYKGSPELGMTKIGEIPMTIYMQLHREGRLPNQDRTAFAKWLAENNRFQTVDGKPI